MRTGSPVAVCCSVAVIWLGFPAAVSAQIRISADDVVERRQEDLEAALTKRGSVDFSEMPLKDAVVELSRQFQIPIVLSVKKMEEASVSPDTPMTIRLDNLSLESILRLSLQAVELSFTIRDEVLLITTPEDVESQLDIRTYPVLDLITSQRLSSRAFVGGDCDSLIELITTTVKPDSWDDVGGPGAIDALDNAASLVIAQTPEVHRQIERLLVSLRRAKQMQGIPSLPLPTVVSQRTGTRAASDVLPGRPSSTLPAWQIPQVYRGN